LEAVQRIRSASASVAQAPAAQFECSAEIAHQTQEHTMKKSIALIFAASTLFLAGCCTTPHVTKWEYKVTDMYLSQQGALEKKINDLVADGWEFVSLSTLVEPGNSPPRGYIVVRRPKQ
jgi:hypothetical protein